MRLWFSKKRPHVALVLHLTSGSVGGALVAIEKGGKPNILASVRRPFFIEAIPNQDDYEMKMCAALRDALATLATCQCGCDTAHVFFSAPWIKTHLTSFAIEESRSFVLDPRTLEHFVRKEETALRQEHLETGREEIFETLVTGVRLNGYDTPMPITKPTTHADIALLMSATETRLRLKIEDEILKAFGLKTGIHMASYASAFSKVILNSFKTVRDALLVTIESEMTDILLLRNGVPVTATSLPFGSAFLARRVARKLGYHISIGYSYLSLYARQDFEDAMQNEIASLVKEGEDEWRSVWLEAEVALSGGVSLPHKVFLVDNATPCEVNQLLIKKVLPHAEIAMIGVDNAFTATLIDVERGVRRDEALCICIAHIADLTE